MNLNNVTKIGVILPGIRSAIWTPNMLETIKEGQLVEIRPNTEPWQDSYVLIHSSLREALLGAYWLINPSDVEIIGEL